MIAMMLFILGATYAGYKVADKAGILRSIPVNKEPQTEKSMVDIGPAPRRRRYVYEAVPYKDLNSNNNTNTDQNAIYIGNNDKVNDISINNVYDDVFNDDHGVNIENNAIYIDNNARNIEKNTIYFEEKLKNSAGHARDVKLKRKPSTVEYIRMITTSRGRTTTTNAPAVKFADDAFLAIFRPMPVTKQASNVTYYLFQNIKKDSRKNPGKYSKIRKLRMHHKEYFNALFKYLFV